ncbi:hypothetical protein CS0771_67540 [Catellatospora sp. IY07-71]|nr:hypothetical protein CS0771_67540 [Catellatospora sp. IY07-71]
MQAGEHLTRVRVDHATDPRAPGDPYRRQAEVWVYALDHADRVRAMARMAAVDVFQPVVAEIERSTSRRVATACVSSLQVARPALVSVIDPHPRSGLPS